MDEEDRRKERRIKAGGATALDEAQANHAQARSGLGVIGFLQSLIGEPVFIEGVRINYRGILREVLLSGTGQVDGLLLEPCQRVSYFQNERGGPKDGDGYTFTRVGRCLVPYPMIHEVGPDGLKGITWPKW